jgi:hypothetical protein
LPRKRITTGPKHWQLLADGLPRIGIEQHLPTERARLEAFKTARWPDKVTCPVCENSDFIALERLLLSHCRGCRHQFSITSGTVLHSSKLDLKIWFSTAEMLIKHFAAGSPRLPTLHKLRGSHAISLPSTALLRKKLMVELSMDNGGLIGTTICAQHYVHKPEKWIQSSFHF